MESKCFFQSIPYWTLALFARLAFLVPLVYKSKKNRFSRSINVANSLSVGRIVLYLEAKICLFSHLTHGFVNRPCFLTPASRSGLPEQSIYI